MTLQIEPLAIGDINAFVELIRESFSPQQLSFTIYACAGITNYVASELQSPSDVARKDYFVLKAGGEILAGIVLRSLADRLNLDYIATKTNARSQGLARKLWQEATKRCLHEHLQFMQLDVFSNNEVALGWYRKLGFTEIGRSTIWSCQGWETKQEAISSQILNLPQAEANHAYFGFSQLNIRIGDEEWTVGRLGTQWYRISNPVAVNNPALLGYLKQFDPTRRILAIVPKDFQFRANLFHEVKWETDSLSLQVPIDNMLS